jgi:hypothetical protein
MASAPTTSGPAAVDLPTASGSAPGGRAATARRPLIRARRDAAPRRDAGPRRDPAPRRGAARAAAPGIRAASAGQATVELVALLPLAALIALAVGQLLAAGAAGELASNAAEAGAAAILQGADPTAAARAALPGWSRERATVRVTGRRVEVRLRPRVVAPVLGDRLEATASADAGPSS